MKEVSGWTWKMKGRERTVHGKFWKARKRGERWFRLVPNSLCSCIYNISSSWDVEASLHWSLDKIPISHVACPGRGGSAEAVGDPVMIIWVLKYLKADRAAPSIAIRLVPPPPIPITTPSTAFKEVTLSLTVNNEGRSYHWHGLSRHYVLGIERWMLMEIHFFDTSLSECL